MKQRLLITDARLPDGTHVDISIADRIIKAIEPIRPALPVERGVAHKTGNGARVLPGFVEGDTHFDKTMWGIPRYRKQSIRRSRSMLVALVGASLLAACATTAQTGVPPELQPAGAPHVVASLAASGVQIYVCKRDQNNQLSWAFKAPQADLYDGSGKLVVKHGAGPSWAASDGSRITGKILQQAPNAGEPGSIPLLLLQATNAGAPGLLSSVRYVQRLHTRGGIAPAQPCTEEGQEGRSPYLADYVFLE